VKWSDVRAKLINDLGRILLKTGALQFGTFTLTSGKLSSYYIDLRIVPSFPGVFRKVISAYVEVFKHLVGLRNVDAVAGIPTAGLPYASAVAYELGKPLIYVRSEERLHGTLKMIEGAITLGWRVTILDDLITTGTSIMRAVDAVRREGGRVQEAVVLIDRREGGAENLKTIGVKLRALTTITELAELLYKMDLIDEGQREAIFKQVGKK